MNKRNDVIQKIRTELNHLTVIEKGFKFFYKNYLCEVVQTDAHRVDAICEETFEYYNFKNIQENPNIRLIGKDPTILDLLDILNTSNDSPITLLNCKGEFQYYKDGFGLYSFKIDLKNPYIKDLDNETIYYLHKILFK